MRISLLGGTRFVGAAILEELVEGGHEVVILHRGETERDDLPEVDHIHLDRHDVASLRAALLDKRPEVLIDTCAYTRQDAEAVAEALPLDVRSVVLSSLDTYRQFHRLRARLPPEDGVLLDEESPIRTGSEKYLYRGVERPRGAGAQNMDEYENLDVEEVMSTRGSVILRLPIVYGERDPIGREEFVLRQVRAGADRVEIGSGTLLLTRAWVRDVARAVRLAAETDAADGMILNIGERKTLPIIGWAKAILEAAESDAELVVVPEHELPAELALTGPLSQHILVDSSKARRVLGWEDSDPRAASKASVTWHLANPPAAG